MSSFQSTMAHRVSSSSVGQDLTSKYVSHWRTTRRDPTRRGLGGPLVGQDKTKCPLEQAEDISALGSVSDRKHLQMATHLQFETVPTSHLFHQSLHFETERRRGRRIPLALVENASLRRPAHC